MTKRIVIDAPDRETITVSLGGIEYIVTPPKASYAMKLSGYFGARDAEGNPDTDQIQEGLNLWVLAAFGKQQGLKVLKRLDDPADNLDAEHITKLVGAVYEDVTGDPPTSPRDS